MRKACMLASIVLTALGCRAVGRTVGYNEVVAFPTQDGAVVTLLDYLETGRRAAQDWLETLPEPESSALAASIARATRASVRLEARSNVSFWGYAQAGGSGVLVDDGSERRLVLTAAHTLDAEPDSVTITTMSGRRFRASVRTLGRRAGDAGPDWALLDLEGEWAALPPAVEIGRAVVGDLAFLLAYPDQCGVDDGGRIVRGDGLEGAPLAPLVTFARVASTAPLLLVPVAGAMPLGGASGGGIFDREGRLVGNLTGVEWEAGRDAVTYRIGACAVTGV